MASFDEIINAVIPWAVTLGGIGLFIWILREPLGALWGAIKGIFGKFKGKDNDSGPSSSPGYIQYE